MKKAKAGLPLPRPTNENLATLDGFYKALIEAKSPAEKLKIASQVHKIARHYDLEECFELAFKYASLYCRAEFSVAKDPVTMDGHFKRKDRNKKSQIKKAYSKLSLQDFEDGISVLWEKGRLPTREWFITKGKPFGTGEFEWYTPPWVYERCRHIMGSIDLDPASSPEAVKMGNKAKRIFTKKDNALKQDWGHYQNIFINPPYTLKDGSSGAKAFLNKLSATVYKQAILLVLEDSGTEYGQALWEAHANCVFIPSSRIHFIYKGESKGESTTRSSLIFGLGVDVLKFKLAFEDWGVVTYHYTTPQALNSEFKKRQESLGHWLECLAKLPVDDSRVRRKIKEIDKSKALLNAPLK